MSFRILSLFLLLAFSHTSYAMNLSAQYERGSHVALSNPHDLKLSPDGRYLFVSDVGNNRVAILDPQTLEFIAEFGADHQSGTHDVDFDSTGQVYVADTHNNRVTIYQLDGLKARLIGELTDKIRGPEGVLIHPNGRIYVAGAWSGNVVVYEKGNVVGELKGLSSPHDLTLKENGDIWLADSGNHRILLLSPELKILKELSQRQYDFDGVRYMDVMDDGTLIAADKYNHQIKFISPEGELLLTLGNGKASMGISQFTTPEGVEVMGDTVWFSDSGNNRVVKYKILQY